MPRSRAQASSSTAAAATATEVLLVHPGGPFFARKDDGAWSIPKGEVEPGEEPLEVALREFEEELGAPPPVVREALVDLGTIRQKAGKVVAAWCARGRLRPDRDHEQHVLDRVATRGRGS